MANDNKLELVIEVDASKGNVALLSFNKSLNKMEKQAVSSSKAASTGFDGMIASMTKSVFAGDALWDMTKKGFETLKQFSLGAVETQAQMGLMAQKVGLSVTEFSALSHVAKMSGLDMSDFSRSVGLLSKNMLMAAQGSKEQKKHFDALGISTKNTDGTLRSATAVLADIADRFKAMPDGAAKTAYAMQLLGRGGKELIPTLNLGGEAIRNLSEEAGKFGLVVTRETAESAHHFEQNLNKLQEAVSGLAFKVSEDLLPALNAFTDKATNWVKTGGMATMIAEIRYFADWMKFIFQSFVDLLKMVSIFLLDIATLISKIIWLFLQIPAIVMPSLKKSAQEWADTLKRGYEVIGKVEYHPLPKFGDLPAAPQPSGTAPSSSDLKKNLVIEENEKEAKKIAHFIAEANKAAAEFRRSAEESLAGGAAREIMEVQKEIDKLTTYIDEEGMVHKVKLSAEARANIEAALQARIQTLQKETTRQAEKDWMEAIQKRFEADTEYYKKRLSYEETLANQEVENARRIMEFQEERAAIERDAALRGLEATEARTPQEKAALESRKADIEIEYIQKVHNIKIALFDAETNEIINQANLQADILEASGQNVSNIRASIEQLKADRATLRSEIDEQTQAAIDAKRQEAGIKAMQAVKDNALDNIKTIRDAAGHIFDDLMSGSKNIWKDLLQTFESVFLTPARSAFQNLAASLFGGGRGTSPAMAGAAGGGGGGGILSGILGGGGGGGGGTPPFMPGGAGEAASAGSGTGGGGLSSLMNLGGLKGFLGMGGEQTAGGMGPTIPFGSLGLSGQLSAIGKSPAMMMAGGLLGMSGLQKGGMTGLGMDIAGGAAIGAHWGLMGAAIGAGVGALAGVARLFFKSATEKARNKIKSTYGIDVKDKGVLQQVVDIAKQRFGNNLDMAIRSKDVSDLIRLYAESTGQATNKLPAVMTSTTLAETGGGVYQAPTYYNGQVVSSSGSLAAMPGALAHYQGGIDYVMRDSLAYLHRGERVVQARDNKPVSLPNAGLGQMKPNAPAIQGPTVIHVNVPGAKDFFENETVSVVARNPRTVQSANINSTRGNFNRRELTALQLSPGTLLS